MPGLLLRQLRRFDDTCSVLRAVVRAATPPANGRADLAGAAVEWAIIRLQDAWAVRCRAIVLASAEGLHQTRSRASLPRSPVLAHSQDPLDFLQRNWTPKKTLGRSWEPKWYAPAEAIRAASLLKIANEAEVTNGLGAATAPEHVRVVRNVLSHSLPNTWARFRQLERALGVTVPGSPVSLATAIEPTASVPYVEFWMLEFRDSLYAALQ
jgi:hypothetical protein